LTGEKARGMLGRKSQGGSSMKKYIVRLSEQEREELEKLIATGKSSAKN